MPSAAVTITMTWVVLTVATHSPVRLIVPEDTEFSSVEECEEFGEERSERMKDWVRGALRKQWDHPVSVSFKCDAGDPA